MLSILCSDTAAGPFGRLNFQNSMFHPCPPVKKGNPDFQNKSSTDIIYKQYILLFVQNLPLTLCSSQLTLPHVPIYFVIVYHQSHPVFPEVYQRLATYRPIISQNLPDIAGTLGYTGIIVHEFNIKINEHVLHKTLAFWEFPSIEKNDETQCTSTSQWLQDIPGIIPVPPCRHCSRHPPPCWAGPVDLQGCREQLAASRNACT